MNMKVEIIARRHSGCTDFVARPARLHLGSQGAQGVDTLVFALPADWAGKSVALHIEHRDGALPSPVLLDGSGRAAVDRRFTAALSGRWMLTATDGAGYTAYTQPGSYDVCESLSTDGGEEPPSATAYEQFVAQVLAGAAEAAAAAGTAAQSAREADAAIQTVSGLLSSAQANAAAADESAGRAEAAALRAEGVAPEGGPVISVNSMGGIVQLDAASVGALPLPETAAAGALLRILSVDGQTGRIATEAVAEEELSELVLHSDIPTATRSGPVRLAGGYGLALTGAGELRLAPADAAGLALMRDGWAPVSAALLPLGVKLALASGWDSAAWDDDSRTAARTTLAAAAAAELAALAARVTALELKFSTEVSEHSFAADLAGLENLTVTGIWNASMARLEF